MRVQPLLKATVTIVPDGTPLVLDAVEECADIYEDGEDFGVYDWAGNYLGRLIEHHAHDAAECPASYVRS